MLPVLSREQSRQFDETCITQAAVPGLLLMENAGRGACDVLLRRYPDCQRVLVVCGSGNNGGDGYVVARRLLTLGRQVVVLALVAPEHLQADAAVQAQAYLGVGGECLVDTSETAAALPEQLLRAQLAVDAIFGTGLTRALSGRYLHAAQHLNAAHIPVCALDLPSGLDADTGQVLGEAVRAECTISFGHWKLGLLTPNARQLAGDVEPVDIGVPADLLGVLSAPAQSASGLPELPPARKQLPAEPQTSLARADKRLDVRKGPEAAAYLLETRDVRRWLTGLAEPRHKGEAGRVALVAGSPGFVGAARLCARGAHRAGAGLVTVLSFPEVIQRLENNAWESMTHALDPEAGWPPLAQRLSQAQAVAIGPGLGHSQAALAWVLSAATECTAPVVLDADALHPFAERMELLRSAAGPRVLTPHPKEAARLLGWSLEQVESNRFSAVRSLAQRSGALVLLKGACTLIAAPDSAPWVCDTGHSTLAVGGSGDVLTGILAALLCRLPPLQAVAAGAWLHGSAAERWATRSGSRRGLLARHLADELPALFGELTRA